MDAVFSSATSRIRAPLFISECDRAQIVEMGRLLMFFDAPFFALQDGEAFVSAWILIGLFFFSSSSGEHQYFGTETSPAAHYFNATADVGIKRINHSYQSVIVGAVFFPLK